MYFIIMIQLFGILFSKKHQNQRKLNNKAIKTSCSYEMKKFKKKFSKKREKCNKIINDQKFNLN